MATSLITAEATIDFDNVIGIKTLDDSRKSTILFAEGDDAKADKEEEQSPPELKIHLVESESLTEDVIARFPVRLSKSTLPISLAKESGEDNLLNTHVVISTLSGTGLAPGFFTNTVSPLLTSLDLHENEDYRVHYTESATTITELTTYIFLPRANNGINQRIILLSGDGGIVDILNSIMAIPHTEAYVEPIISLLPLGTGNALAHSSGITKDNTLGLRALVGGTSKPLPIFEAAFSEGSRLLVDEGSKEEALPLHNSNGQPILYGAVVCSWGLHASLVADSDTAEYRKYGIQRFGMAAKENLFPPDGSESHRYKARVSLGTKSGTTFEWKVIDRTEHAYVLATLVSNLEKSFTISPASRPLEGSLRVVHFGHLDGNEVMRIMGLAYQGGKHVGEEVVGYEDVESILIDFGGREEDGRWRRICVDGKIVRVDNEGWVEVKKETRKVLKVTN
jgi:diacylglycerol kinase family enzyme